ncbi:ABC transporter permease subunit [Rhodococcus pseudokoreensis]|uniref:ABC transporter permease subunit n=1 Tax=Rhodococcus pseudokoreensis TaxID=2811421 RepID=A0A974ZUB2_9NOCA|nr:ABC transporter permease subunit [Rhodococcus pseudokoreensis]QSE90651.1 ABC transporter permease subunit [Rhodococcus pseudokoreensis]
MIAFLLAWEFIPQIDGISGTAKWLDPFFISSPTAVAQTVWDLGAGNIPGASLWSYLYSTLFSTVVGATIGLVLGAAAGLVLSNSPKVNDVLQPFIVLLNSVPRVALIPIIVIVVGPSLGAAVISVAMTVFFLGFFNAYEGGLTIQQAMIDNAKLLGAGKTEVMRTIRLPMVAIWTFAVVPNAISFGLLSAVFTELLTGIPGIGTLLQNATVNVNADLMFAVVVILAVVGLVLYWLALKLRSAVIRWE